MGKRVYVPLPDPPARGALLYRLFGATKHELSQKHMAEFVKATKV
jgi:hypothetical protein